MPDIKGNNQQIFDFLSSKGASGIGNNADEFQKFMENDANRRQVYDYLSSVKAQGIGDSYESFSSMVYAAPETAKEQTAAPENTDAPAPAGTSSSRGRMSTGSSPKDRTKAFNERFRERERAMAEANPEQYAAEEARMKAAEDAKRAQMKARKEERDRMMAQAQEPAEAQEPVATQQEGLDPMEARRKEVESLTAELEKYSEVSDLVKEYERRLDENKKSLDPGSKKVQENNDWLYAHRDAYRAAKNGKDMREYNRIKRRIYELTVVPALDDVESQLEENRALVSKISGSNAVRYGSGGFVSTSEDPVEDAKLAAADELLNMARQTLKQGSKFDEGYETKPNRTAVGQFLGSAAGQVDMGTFTLGLSEGASTQAARAVGEKYNGAINAAIKGLGYTDKDVDDLIQGLNDNGKALEELIPQLNEQASAIETMEATYNDMVKNGASERELAAYAKQYDQKVKEYNRKVKDEYQPLYGKYEEDQKKYKTLMSAVDESVASSMTEGDRAILKAFDSLVNANAVTEGYTSTAAKAGAGFENTLEFMVDFWLTKGLDKAGSKAATKIATRRAIKKYGVDALKNMAIRPGVGTRMLTDLGVSAARTAALPTRFAQNLGEQLTQLDQTPYGGKDELGRYQFGRSHGNAMANTAVEDFIEYWSEGFGEYFGAAEKALFKSATRSAPRTMIGQTLKNYKGSVGRFLDNAKFNGQLNETLEEVVGAGLNSLFGWMSDDRVGDKGAMEEFWKKENLATLTMSFLPLSAIGATTNLVSYHQMRSRYNKGVQELKPFVESGAISQKELDDLSSNLMNMTPEQVKDRIVSMTDRAREANGGHLPKDFAQNLMGYIEGSMSMDLRSDEWDASKEKIALVNAYEYNYAEPNPNAMWDLDQNEAVARQDAVDAGFDENELDLDSYILGQEAYALRLQGEEERADILMNYATAKAQTTGLRKGYAEQTRQMNERNEDYIRGYLDTNGQVVEGTVGVDGTQMPVYIVQDDATVNPDGTVSTPTGDGLVTYFDKLTGRNGTAKADAFSEVKATQTDQYIADANAETTAARDEAFRKAESTVSQTGMEKAVAENVGQTVFVDNHQGVYEPVTIDRMTNEGATAVISAQNKSSMQAVARALGVEITGSTHMEVPTDALYNVLAKDENQNISTQMPETAPAAQTQEAAAPESSLEDLIDTDVQVSLNGNQQTVHVDDVNDGKVTYTETGANGKRKTRRKSMAEFQNAMQAVAETPAEEPAPVAEEPAPAAETPAPAAQQEVVPERGTIPRDEKGRKVYDAPGVSVEDALDDLYKTPGLTEEKVDQYIADRAAQAEAARNPEMGDMTPEEWGAATMEANRVADFWNAMKQAAEARKQPAPAQEAAPVNREIEQAPNTETAPDGKLSKTARKLVKRLERWQDRTGVPVRVCYSMDDVMNADAKAAMTSKTDRRILTGSFDPNTGAVEIYMFNIDSEAELDRSFIHEVVSHRGLRGLLGEQGYADLCDRVWNELMTDMDKAKYVGYNRHTNLVDEGMRRAAADEYIANLSENLDFYDNRSLFQKIVDWVRREILKEELSVEDYENDAKERATGATPSMSRDVLEVILSDSMKRYVQATRDGKLDADQKRKIGADVAGGAMQTDTNRKGQTRFSMKSIVTGGGLDVIEDNGRGMVAFVTTDGRAFDAENPVTAQDLAGLGNTVMGHMMKDAREHAGLKPELEARIWQAYADQLNAFLAKGVAKDGLSGADRLKALWQWEVENTVYKSVSTNGDAQYSYSIDITRVCKKNEAVIKAISAMQRKVGHGLTPGEIMDIYMAGIDEGYQVPCPVCYVFSRYIRNGIVATVAINGQEKYGKYLVDPSTLTEEQRQERIKFWSDELRRQEALNEKNKKEINKAKKDCTEIIEQINEISRMLTSGQLDGKARAKAERTVKALDNRYRAALNTISQSSLTGWIKQFAIREDKDGYQPEGSDKKYSLWEDTFQGFPPEYALDLRLTAETIEMYPAIQRLRNARGSAGGKEIHFASNNDIGDIPMMLGSGNKDNFYQKAVMAETEKERDKWLKKATERFKGAHKYAQQQSLRGGQRMWSWSDNIERLGPDVFVNLLQLQMLGGALQAYSKQLEGVNLVASMGGYVNGSLMGYGKGWTELTQDDIAVMNGREVLSHDIKDTVTEKTANGEVQRERFLAKAGAPVLTVDGKKVTLLFDDVVGIDAYGREKDGRHLKGLFDLNGELDKAGNIIVGMNDTHVRASMADPRVFFIIPWHSSGNSVHIVQQMLSYLGVGTDLKDYKDYTSVQEEKDLAGSDKISQFIVDFWEAHKNETDYPVGVKGGTIPSGRNGKLSPQQKHYRELRNAIFDGKLDEHPGWRKEVEADAFLSQVLRKVDEFVDDKEMTNGDKKFIYPYEYWNEASTYDTADENGARYLEYCRRLGYKPKFVGKLDGKPEEDFGNFAEDTGYWKLLIDRRMYGVDGRFQDLTPTTTENYDPRMVDPEWTRQNFTETKAFDRDEVAEQIADRVIEKEGSTLPGGLPSVDYGMDLDQAVKKYNAVLKLTKDVSIKDLVKMARPEAAVQGGTMFRDASSDPQVSEGGATMFRERTAPDPEKRQKVYKLMRLGEDGKLYPLFIDSASPIELKKWYDADSPDLSMLQKMPNGVFLVDYKNGTYTSIEDYKKERGEKVTKMPNADDINEATESGLRWMRIQDAKSTNPRYKEKRLYDNIGIDGGGGVSTYAMRPGWHAGSLPTMRQIGLGPRDAKEKFRDDRFVWVEGYVPADVDYNEEAQGNPGQDIPTHIPENGYYMKATNANKKASQADRVGWYVAGSFYPDRIIGDREARQVIDEWNDEHPDAKVEYDWPRYDGREFNAETMQLEDPDKGPDGGGTRFRKVEPIIDEKNDAIFEGAKRTFGTTRNLSEAGYALPDGSMLDFSGRHLLGPGQDVSWMNGMRQVDHREITDMNYEKDGNTPTEFDTDMRDFIRRGAIRLNSNVINLAQKPTRKQEDVIWSLVSRADGNVDVDFGDGYESDHYAAYEGARPERIINDIRRYFDEGENPEGNVRFREREEERKNEQAREAELDARFNRQIDYTKEAIDYYRKNGEMPKDYISATYRLGTPFGTLLAAGMDDVPIRMKEDNLLDASAQGPGFRHGYHKFDISDLKNLVSLINHPIAVTRTGRSAFGILLDKKDKNGDNYYAYVRGQYGENGGPRIGYEIISVYPVNKEWKKREIIENLVGKRDELAWADTKKVTSWVNGKVSNLRSYYATTQEVTANIEKKFGNKQDLLRIDAENRGNDAVRRRPNGKTMFRDKATSERDEEFRQAAMSGDEKAREMLGDAFLKAYPNTKILDMRGKPLVVYHGTKSPNGERPYNTLETGHFTDDKPFADYYAAAGGGKGYVYPVYINMENPMVYDFKGQNSDFATDEDGNRISTFSILEKAKQLGHDGVILLNVDEYGTGIEADEYGDYDGAITDYIPVSPETQVKSAELFERDDNDELIPLSERFKQGNNDIRFREAGGIPANEAYENEIRKKTTNILMEFQDGDIPVRIAVNNIMNEVDKRHLADDEDYLTRHNLVSSMADAQMHKFKLFYYEPLVKAIGKIEEKLVGKKSYFWNKADYEKVYGRVKRYIYAVSALERNAWKRDEADKKKKDAIDRLLSEKNAEIDRVVSDRRIETKEALDRALDRIEDKYDKKYREINSKYADRDYSGITALMGRPKDEWREAETEAQAMVDDMENALGSSADLLDELWDRLRACTDYNLEFAYKYGLLTRAEFERLHGTSSQPRLWEHYVPLRGFSEKTAEDLYGYRMFVSSDKGDAVAKKAKGRVTEADDPVANIRHIAELGIVQALNNWAKQALYNFALSTGDNTLLTPVEPWYKRDSDTGDWVIVEPRDGEKLDDFEERMEALQASEPDNYKHERTGLKLGVIMADKAHRNEHMIRLKVRGVDKGIWVHGDPALAKVVNGVGGWRHKVTRGIRRVNRGLSQFYTTYSVNFLVKNKQRDTQFSRIAALVDESQEYLQALEKNWWANNGYVAGGYPMMKLVKAWESGELDDRTDLTEREQMFVDFMYDGGATGYTVMNTMEDIKKDLQKMVERAGKEQRNISPIAFYAKAVGAMNEAGELLTRFTFYQTSRQMGRSRQRAAYDAKESSVNFNRRGLQSGEGVTGWIAAATGMLYLFFNPAIQGLDKFVRLHKSHPWRMGMVDATYFMMGFVNSMLNAMIAGYSDGDDDDDKKMGPDWYWNIPEWVRRSNIIIGSPFKKLGKWGYLVIALPIEYKGFYAMGELASALVQKKYAAKDAKTIANEVVGVVAELLPVNPVEGYTPGDNALMSIGRNLAPGSVAPLVDVATNRSFSGIPLWKENIYDENQPLSQSAFASTPEILNKAVIKLSEVTSTMPWHVDIPSGAVRGLLKGYGGGAYTFVENMYKIVFADEAHPRRYENIPYISGFTGYLDEDRRNSFNSNALQRYKELEGDVIKRIRSAAGDPTIKESTIFEHPEELEKNARVQQLLEGERWILGQMYYEGMKERSGEKEPSVGKDGKVRMVAVKDDIKSLRSAWQKAKDEYLEIAKDKNATQEEKDAAEEKAQKAWLAYTNSEDSLVDSLLKEEYDNVQTRMRNGLPFEPKETLSEKVYKLTNKRK